MRQSVRLLRAIVIIIGILLVAFTYWNGHSRASQGLFPPDSLLVLIVIAYGGRASATEADFARAAVVWIVCIGAWVGLSARASSALAAYNAHHDVEYFNLYANRSCEFLVATFVMVLPIPFFVYKNTDSLRKRWTKRAGVQAVILLAGCVTVYFGKRAALPPLDLQSFPSINMFNSFQSWLVQASCVLCGLLIISMFITSS